LGELALGVLDWANLYWVKDHGIAVLPDFELRVQVFERKEWGASSVDSLIPKGRKSGWSKGCPGFNFRPR